MISRGESRAQRLKRALKGVVRTLFGSDQALIASCSVFATFYLDRLTGWRLILRRLYLSVWALTVS